MNRFAQISPQLHERGMSQALAEARRALAEEETPVGAALCRDGALLASSHNLCRQKQNPTLHAELLAIQAVCAMGAGPYLRDCILYVTLEPCCQCAAALAHVQLGALVFAAYDPQQGACGSAWNLNGGALGWAYPVWGGYMRAASEALLDRHFGSLRGR